MSEEKQKRVVEWSFSFGELGESINQTLRQMGVDAEVKTAHFSEPVGSATAANIRLNLATGKMIVHALTGSDNLLEADVRYIGEMEFNVSGDTEKTVSLGQKNIPSVIAPFKDLINSISNHDDLRWEIALSPNLPLDLNVHGGVGVSKLDLSGLQLKRLNIKGGVGETQLTLPVMPTSYDVDIDGGVGETVVNIPEGAVLRLHAKGGVGEAKIRLPESAAVRIEAKGGIGGAKLPSRFKRLKGGDDFMGASGTWETDGFALAQGQIFISFTGGVGGLKVS
jgi:hypothetical protein